MIYYAHSLDGRSRCEWQTAAEHLTATSALAQAAGEKFGAGRAAALGGALHDLGKYTPGFNRRLDGGSIVDHATAGAQEIVRLTAGAPLLDRTVARLIAHAITGHHGGMPDGIGE